MKDGRLAVIVLAAVVGAIVGAGVVGSQTATVPELSKEQRIADFYATETAAHASPHHIRKAIAKGDQSFILVDLRSQEEYEKEHVVGAVSIPAYKDKDTSAYGEVERIVNSFKELGTDKEIIVYCYSIPCMTGRKVGKMLADNGIFVKHLGVGWNEWRYFWDQWNHEHEWEATDVEDYVATGAEPGVFEGDVDGMQPCSIEGELGC